MVNILRTSPVVQDRFISLQTVLQDPDKRVDIVEDKYAEAGYSQTKRYLLTRFSTQQPQTVEEIAKRLAKKNPKIPRIAGLYKETDNFFIVQDYIIDNLASGPGKFVPPRNEYELVTLLNRLLPTISFLQQLSSSSAQKPADTLRDLTANVLSLTGGQGQSRIYDVQTGAWNGKRHLSDQRVEVLDHILSADGKLPTAEAFLKALNTIDQPREEKQLPTLFWYVFAGAIGLLALVALTSFWLSRETPIAIEQPTNPFAAKSCPTGTDILPIGCNAAVVDSDSPNFDGGKLTVSVSKGAIESDRIFLQQQNVTVEANQDVQEVSYRNNVIGTLSSSKASVLEVVFNESATTQAVDALLQDVVYQNTADASAGTREVTFQITDGDNGQSDFSVTTVGTYAVNSAPTVTVPSAQTVQEDGEISFGGIKVADADVGESLVTAVLSVNRGVIAIDRSIESGAVVQAERSGKRIFLRGTLAQVNQTLSGTNAISYKPDKDVTSSDTLRIEVTDSGQIIENRTDWLWPAGALDPRSNSASLSITIKPVNDAPSIQLERGSGNANSERFTETPEPASSPTVSPNSSGNTQRTNATIAGDPTQLKNIRASNNTSARVLFELRVGSRVQILNSRPNSDGFVWYEIYSPDQDAQGWIANNLVDRD